MVVFMKLSIWLPAVLLCLSIVPASGAAQTPPVNNTPPQFASDPGQFLRFTQQQNGLHDLTAPWHVRATWQLLDAKGKPVQQGTWEEWSAGPHQWERISDAPDFKETIWRTPQGSFSLKERGELHWVEALVGQMVLQPIHLARRPDGAQPKAVALRKNGVALDCLVPPPAQNRPHRPRSTGLGTVSRRCEPGVILCCRSF